VAHDVLAPEVHEVDPVDVVEDVRTTIRPDCWSRGRSICVTSPVMTIFELNPRRVRNIFICSGEVFCASSRITNESLSVRPAHERQRRDLDRAALEVLLDLVGVEHVLERVEERAQVRVDLRHQVAGQEAEPLAASTAGRVRMIRLTSRRESAAARTPRPATSCRCRPGRSRT
jgi:hypothetical protein